MKAPVPITHFISSWSSPFSASFPYHPSILFCHQKFPLTLRSSAAVGLAQAPELNTGSKLSPPCSGTMAIKHML